MDESRPEVSPEGQDVPRAAPPVPKPSAPPRDVRPGQERMNALGLIETELEREARNQRLLNHPDPVIRAHLREKAGLKP